MLEIPGVEVPVPVTEAADDPFAVGVPPKS